MRARFIWAATVLLAANGFPQGKPDVFVQLGHSADIRAVAFSPDGRRVLSGAQDSTLKLWDAETGRELRTFIGSSNWIRFVGFSPDGRSVLGGGSQWMKIWDIASGGEIHTFSSAGPDGFESAAFSPDGRTLLTGPQGQRGAVQLWDVATGRELRRFGSGTISSLAFSPNGRLALLGGRGENGQSCTIKLWEPATGRLIRTLTGHPELKHLPNSTLDAWCEVSSAAFSPDGQSVVSGGEDGTVRTWDVATGHLAQTFTGLESVASVAFSGDGRAVLAAPLYAPLRIWSARTGAELASGIKQHLGSAAAFSADRRWLIVAKNKQLSLWDLDTGRELRTFSGETWSVNTVLFSPSGDAVLQGSMPVGWNLVEGRAVVTSLKLGEGGYLAYSHDGRLAIAGFPPDIPTLTPNINLVDVGTGRELGSFGDFKDGLGMTDVLFSPDNRLLLSLGLLDPKLWDVATRREVRTFAKAKNDLLSHAAFSPDGRFLLLSSDLTALLSLREVETGREVRSFKASNQPIFAVACSPDGKTALSASADKTLKLWDLSSGQELRTFAGHTAAVTAVAFSRDGRIAVSGGVDETLRVWDVATGRELRSFYGHTEIKSVALSPDGRSAVAGGADGSLGLYSIASGSELLRMIGFTDGEWVAITPAGYYNASPKGDQHLNVRIGENVYGIDQWRATFYNPAVVTATLRLADPAAAIAEVLGTGAHPAMIEPPFVVVRSPEDGSRLSSRAAELSVYVEDRHKDIRTVKVLINGKVAGIEGGDVPAGRKTLSLRAPITLDAGDNLIEVTAYNGISEGKSSLHLTVTEAAPARILPSLWILGIAVNQYHDAAIPPLQYAVSDVQAIVNTFSAQKGRLFGDVHTLVLTGDAPDAAHKATRANIVDNFGFLNQAGQNDMALLFVSGHGDNDAQGNYYFLPSDASLLPDGSLRPSSAVSWRELKSVLDGAGSKLVLLDTCHSEGFSGRKTTNRALVSDNTDRLVRELRDFGAVVFASSRGNETAKESPQWGHGAFTYALINGLEGAANLLNHDVITMKELDTYVSGKVPELTGGAQHPVTYTPEGYVNFPVAKLK